ncbi:DUF1266 domain-containing protein [Streptomyces gilvosporeus]|uniref:DUF1266 domain-containing protein n=1 Tax=Streptomyces gilvosporeus TaxID=553510 RepID=A0A1V0TK35_9ACTN|nr:DUF1266 domain-containing protein [Streptomyces gilvosporeus]ARF53012.1 hypothetical protein B1H19_01355 [Streptomyces gilvosporeus]
MSGWILASSLLKMAFGPSAKRRYPAVLTPHQRWMVSLDAILTERMWGHGHLMLYPLKRINPSNCKVSLAQSWDITSPESLQAALHRLAAEGHRMQMAPVLGHPPVAWDFGRYVSVVRSGFGAGYVDEAGAWQLLARAAAPVAQTYGSWRAFADDFVAGRQIWMQNVGREWAGSQEDTIQAVQRLLDPANPNSPWNQVPWETIYQPDQVSPQPR